MNGAKCVQCSRVHGPLPSLLRHWHRCQVCTATYCYGCGFKLSLYDFRGIGELLEAMSERYTNPNVRACALCKGPTDLV
jgi:hypothetical protein